jgi:LysR family glycine cleavage system transcriptional activator
LSNFEHEAIDCAIYSGQPERPGLTTAFLRNEMLIVVCAPTTITPAKPLACPADLRHHHLLHVRSRSGAHEKRDDWDIWLQSIGIKEQQDHQGLVLENRNFLIQAAKSGLGIAIVDALMVQDELKSGQLIQPLSMVVKSNSAYYLAYPNNAPPPQKVVAFRDWLMAELRDEEPMQAQAGFS